MTHGQRSPFKSSLIVIATFILTAAVATAAAMAAPAQTRELTFEDRVNAQRVIEQVYWNHRIWPKENPGPKPPLSAVMPDSAIRAKVEDSLRMSALLDSYWHRPLTGEQLQAEIDRMVRSTKAPQTLRELFAALDDDPFLIAECLARPALTAQRVRAAFAGDSRIHGAQRAALAEKLAGVADLAALARVEGDHAEVALVLDERHEGKGPSADPNDRAIRMSREEWDRATGRLAKDGVSVLPIGRLSSLIDRNDRFVVQAVRSRSQTEVTLVSVSWPKRAYADWARERGPGSILGVRATAPPKDGYSLTTPKLDECTDDAWTPTAGSEVPTGSSGATAVWTGSEMIVWGGYSNGLLHSGGRYDPSTDSWSWSSLSTGSGASVPNVRDEHTAVWTGNEMIVWGGNSCTEAECGPVNSGGRYNPSTDTWAASSLTTGSGANVPDARNRHTAVWTGSEMIVWGGEGPSIGWLSTGGRFNPSTDTWAASSLATGSGANVPEPRRDHTAVWTGSEMIVWGGSPDCGETDCASLNTGGRYDPSTDSWASSSLTTGSGANVSAGRQAHTAVWTGSEMIVWGGESCGESSCSFTNTGGRYAPSTDSWAACSLTLGSGANVPELQVAHVAVWTGSEMIVWGGYGANGRLNTGGRYNPSTDSWAACSLTLGSGANVPSARVGHAAVWTGSEMIVWGGELCDPYCAPSNTGGRYDPSTDSWAASSLTNGVGPNVPDARWQHTAVWTGSEMIVWGGLSGFDLSSGLSSTGGRYDPATDSWADSSLAIGSGANVPERRIGHAAVWTGNEMIVWGGYSVDPDDSSIHDLNTGGRYNPLTDSWAATSLTTGAGSNVPEGRNSHTVVWTGSEMVVWGGSDAFGTVAFNTGGLYNPSTDSWAASSLTTGSGVNAPEGRNFHTAVWTGSEMIVWGGYNDYSTGELSTGGRYDPYTDTWADCSLTSGDGANVPAGRSDHTAVWTGSEMVVWGGSGESDVTCTGGRYDPSTDSWADSALVTGSGANVPDARANHAAIWTGSEMIVWGGYSTFATINTGGRYDPSTDSWAASSLATGSGANVPASRDYPSVVWTGPSDRRMIVWGGANGPATYEGRLYCAQPCTPLTWYQDADGDGHGSPLAPQSACTQPPGRVAAGDDCDDTNPNIHPGAPELCNGIDDNCNVAVDEPFDTDGDLFSDCLDNCPGINNPTQADLDADQIGDPCDCWPSDSANPPPPEVSSLTADGRDVTSIAWPAAAANVRYNVYRGYRTTGNAWSSTYQCLAGGLATEHANDSLSPRSSTGFYYLVSSVCPNGAESALGRDSSGAPIGVPALITDRCPNPILDTDRDGTNEASDNCPGLPNGSQSDVDGDSHGDVCDNCPNAANTEQTDASLDGIGDACDLDTDGDEVPNDVDNCPLHPNADQQDEDVDGVGEVCDNCPGAFNPNQADSDGDGIGDACDTM